MNRELRYDLQRIAERIKSYSKDLAMCKNKDQDDLNIISDLISFRFLIYLQLASIDEIIFKMKADFDEDNSNKQGK
jgi:hypothetical protein